MNKVALGTNLKKIGSVAFAGASFTHLHIPSTLIEIAEASVAIRYLPNAQGWRPTFAGRATAPWLPEVRSSVVGFDGAPSNFALVIEWARGQTVAIEVTADLAKADWQELKRITLPEDAHRFHDARAALPGHTRGFYRIRNL